MTIHFEAHAIKVIQSPAEGAGTVIRGTTGAGKTTLLMERYRYLVEQLHVPSDRILVLLSNPSQLKAWKNAIQLRASAGTRWMSYIGFVREELTHYYPLALKRCIEVGRKEVKPVFLSYETARHLMTMAVKARREREGFFSTLVASHDRIAQELADNGLKAALSCLPWDCIGSRLFDASPIKDELKRKLYSDADEVIRAYRKRCLELGVLDDGMAVELYHNTLLQDPLYWELLRKRTRHLLVDDLHLCSSAAYRLIEILASRAESCMVACNPDGAGEGGGSGWQQVIGMLSNQKTISKGDNGKTDEIAGRIQELNLDKPYTADRFLVEFSEMLFDSIESGTLVSHKAAKIPSIERQPATELRSEMLEKAGERVCQLIRNEGCRPSDIVILSTFADKVTELVIAGVLEKAGIRLENICTGERMWDSVLCRSMITFAQLCHPGYKMHPMKDDIRIMIRRLMNLDPVRSSILARKTYNTIPFAEMPGPEWEELGNILKKPEMEHYLYVRRWIEDYKQRDDGLPMNEFLQRCLVEVFLSEELDEREVFRAKQLIDQAAPVTEVLAQFQRNCGRDYLEMAANLLRLRETPFETEEKTEGDQVLLATPTAYLSSAVNAKVTVLCGLSSDHWSTRRVKDLSNPHIFSSQWEDRKVYTEELEEKDRRHALAEMVRALLKKSGERLITFESMLDAGGYENPGLLSDIFDEILEA